LAIPLLFILRLCPEGLQQSDIVRGLLIGFREGVRLYRRFQGHAPHSKSDDTQDEGGRHSEPHVWRRKDPERGTVGTNYTRDLTAAGTGGGRDHTVHHGRVRTLRAAMVHPEFRLTHRLELASKVVTFLRPCRMRYVVFFPLRVEALNYL
jgi:hypothetical protein